MEMKMNTELELELAWLFEERSEDPCEAKTHRYDTDYHSGPGEWLIRGEGCPCRATGQKVLLVCDTFKTLVIDTGAAMLCVHCGLSMAVDFEILGRKGVDF